jgi:hypothetical protein
LAKKPYRLKAKDKLHGTSPMRTTPIALRLEESYIKLLDEMAMELQAERATVSSLIRKAIQQFLEREGKLKP